MRTLRWPKPTKEEREKRKQERRAVREERRSSRTKALLGPAGAYRAKVKYANDLWREIVRSREPSGTCPNCMKRKWHDAAHGWPKGPYPWMRFELTNGIPLCRVCHRRVDSDFAAKTELWVRYYGRAECEKLHLMSQAQGRSKMDMTLVIMFLESEVAKLKKR